MTLLRTGSTVKSVRSQVVAATLARASRASVPTHGRCTFGTIGRSTLASRPGTSPTGTGATSSVSGVVAQPSPCGVGHMPLTAMTSIRVAPATSGRALSSVRKKVVVVIRPVRATPAR